jgi:hypothetical protein
VSVSQLRRSAASVAEVSVQTTDRNATVQTSTALPSAPMSGMLQLLPAASARSASLAPSRAGLRAHAAPAAAPPPRVRPATARLQLLLLRGGIVRRHHAATPHAAASSSGGSGGNGTSSKAERKKWPAYDKLWAVRYASVAAWAAAHGGCTKIPRYAGKGTAAELSNKEQQHERQLGNWVKVNKDQLLQGKPKPLTDARRAQLEALSYVWRDGDAGFEHGQQQLAAYAAAHAWGAHVPRAASDADWPGAAVLREWLKMQRLRHEHGTLTPERAAALDALGVIWDVDDAEWEAHRVQLATYAAANGGVTTGLSATNILARWVRTQREWREMGRLKQERVDKLDAMGFVWRCKEWRV